MFVQLIKYYLTRTLGKLIMNSKGIKNQETLYLFIKEWNSRVKK